MWSTLKSTSWTSVREPIFTSLTRDATCFFLRLLRLLLLLVAELAVVHDPADRRVGRRRDLDQVELFALGDPSASGVGITPSCPPSASITRTSRARIW